ncbi:hypothetical protein [Marinospirillum sp.]|uniref:hypothetical protein n=1 Tax=Marinospirillum sp. TaxID=2183934 RepID=UPI00384CDEA5
MKKLFFLTALISITSYSYAENTIFDSLKENASLVTMTSHEMSDAKGAALISGQPYPSVTAGLTTHHITYLGWGSYSDYQSYNYIGSAYSNDDYSVNYEGNTYAIGGDEWMADIYSDPNSWSLNNAQLIEYHYQILHPETLEPSNFAFRESAWNRPITTFSW